MERGLITECVDEKARELLKCRLLPLTLDQIVDVMARVMRREMVLDSEVKRLHGELNARRNRRYEEND
jgi:hypothetical protein